MSSHRHAGQPGARARGIAVALVALVLGAGSSGLAATGPALAAADATPKATGSYVPNRTVSWRHTPTPTRVPATATLPPATATPTQVPATATRPPATATAAPILTNTPLPTSPTATPATPTTAMAPIRIEAGSTSAYTDSSGAVWQADTAFVDGGIVDRGPLAIANTTDPRLYQTERWGLSAYQIPVPNGTYTVRLHFAETYSGITGPGQRLFGLMVEGTDLGTQDIFAQAGGTNRALVKTVTVPVSDGQLNITFTPQVQETMIDGIEVVATSSGAAATATPSPAATAAVTATAAPPTATPTALPATATATPTSSPLPTPSATPTAPPSSASPAYAAAVLADRPAAYWRLDDSSGASAADQTGAYPGTYTGSITRGAPSLLASDLDPAATFPGGTSAGVSAGNVLDFAGTAPFSLEAWVQPNLLDGVGRRILSKDDPSTGTGWDLWASSSGFAFNRAQAGVATQVTSSTAPVVGATSHVVGTYDGTSLRLYVNGVLAGGPVASAQALSATTANLTLANRTDGARGFGGTLDEVAVYSQALSPAQVLAHFQAGSAAATSGLLASAPVAPSSSPTPMATATAISSSSLPTCTTSLQSLLDNAPAGSTVKLPACAFRETASINKPLTIDGQNQAEIRGSDVWTGWTQSGTYWVHGGVPVFDNGNPPCQSGTSRCAWPEQVFFDGRPLQQVASNPSTGQFAVDGSRRAILADNPTGHTVEVTMRTRWLYTNASGVTIQNIGMRHAAPAAQQAAISNNSASNFTLQDCRLSDTSAWIVSIGGGTGNKVLRCDIARGGQGGISGYDSTGALLQGNKVHDNNTEQYDAYWEAGGMKLIYHHGLVVDSNEVYANDGVGIWCDIQCDNVTYSNNKAHDNNSVGLMFEISDGAKIYSNTVWNNGFTWGEDGIYISNSRNAEVYNNTVAWNRWGINVILDNRSDNPPGGIVNNYVHDNTIIMGRQDLQAVKWIQIVGDLYSVGTNNRGANNHYWYPSAEDGQCRYQWAGCIGALAAFNATGGEEGARYLTSSEKDAVLTASGMPLTSAR